MEGVVLHGTAAGAVKLDRQTAGKTGTTNDEKDAWFVGYTTDLVAGLYMGFDTPSPMGRGSTGGGLAAPIFNEFMNAAVAGTPAGKFHIPEGMTLVPVNRKTGMQASEGDPDTIMEAFKPGTGPADSFSVIGGMDNYMAPEEILKTSPQANQAVTSGSGGLF